MEAIVSLAKRRGFVWRGSDIYGGLAGTWDWAPFGALLKRAIADRWWHKFVRSRNDIYGIDTAILMSGKVWEASGHLAGFSDPLAQCELCKKRFRRDHVSDITCPECGGKLAGAGQFNMMFGTEVGVEGGERAYLRPETAQGMFVNFKNIVDSFHPRLPFGVAQIGKAFRNEISPRDFLFRAREFEQMEIEYFVHPDEWEKHFEQWRTEMKEWITDDLGLTDLHVHEVEVAPEERAHYSKRTIDFEFDFPFGRKELYGLAYRGDYDLTRHSESSSEDLSYFDDTPGVRFIPHVIEPTFGLDRTVLAVLLSAYREDTLPSAEGGAEEKRVYLALPNHLAPVRAAVFPLLKNKPELVLAARSVYDGLRKEGIAAVFDDNGNIGKRYRRQDEIGTPHCITIDFQTLDDNTVTLRNRDTGAQERVLSESLSAHLGV